ncbi:hypothetical protein BASA61_009207 [Batrachochytrium salamandrivorans]|nr:hypothetical protein BASA60_007757 [Batrachochytrium salamandrivorans]KAH6581136.1 hypothetical protein BASA61_009207 [Batrachochytrium salamandrivorans]KAH9277000.1 hypothetical protein BASA83_000517 [Batrachochytrium salamandrivorans]KAJ1344270.1 hypothetical protein BSLG_001410 [Batrachochytrium salamandrivorans]
MRLFKPLQQAVTSVAYKKTTGLFGLAVHPSPKPVLCSLYSRIMNSLKQLPDSSAYKHSTHNLVKERLEIVNSTDDISSIEQKINAGQIEELIYQAEMELKLIPNMDKWRAYEPLEETPLPGQWRYFK